MQRVGKFSVQGISEGYMTLLLTKFETQIIALVAVAH